MTERVLILGGRGRVGKSVTHDLITHTRAHIVVTGRSPVAQSREDLSNHLSAPDVADLKERTRFLALDLADQERLQKAIADADLVVHCAGPFLYRDARVLETCIEQGVNYLDVSDNRAFTRQALSYHPKAEAVGVTAIVNSGIFPGISNSMARQAVEQLDKAEQIHLSYVVGGSGGAGITVMRTTFLGIQNPFEAWIDGEWKIIKPYSDRETIEFPTPYGRAHVYWFDMPEAFTLVEAFPVKTVITKFGSVPDFYNHLTWIAAHWFPSWVMHSSNAVEFLSHVSHRMTDVTDRFSGIGVAVRCVVNGYKDGHPAEYQSAVVHESAAVAAGCGTGSVAELMLSGRLRKPGVYPIEQILSTDLFEQTMESRKITVVQGWAKTSAVLS